VVDLADDYYKKHEGELAKLGIKSTTGLITFWVQESLKTDTKELFAKFNVDQKDKSE